MCSALFISMTQKATLHFTSGIIDVFGSADERLGWNVSCHSKSVWRKRGPGDGDDSTPMDSETVGAVVGLPP